MLVLIQILCFRSFPTSVCLLCHGLNGYDGDVWGGGSGVVRGTCRAKPALSGAAEHLGKTMFPFSQSRAAQVREGSSKAETASFPDLPSGRKQGRRSPPERVLPFLAGLSLLSRDCRFGARSEFSGGGDRLEGPHLEPFFLLGPAFI